MKKGTKYDTYKNQLALIDPKFIKELGSLMTFGAKKYAPNNWKKVKGGKERYKNALLRHLYAYLDGELLDEDSGELHLTCVGFNAMALSWFERGNNNACTCKELTHCTLIQNEYICDTCNKRART